MTGFHDGPGRSAQGPARPQRFAGDPGRAMIVVIVVIVVAVGGLGFLLVHPSGQAAFKRFLNDASGKTSQDPDTSGTQAAPQDELPPEARADLDRAHTALEKEDFDGARAACGEALAKAPDSAEAAELLKKIDAKRALARERERKVLFEAALKAAGELLAAGDLDRAEERLNDAFAQNPGSPSALAIKVKIAMARERQKRERAGNRRRADDLSHEGTLALGDADRALALAAQALEIDPENMAAKNLRSQAELAKKRAAEAAAAANASPDPISTPAGASKGQGEFEIGRICWQSGDVEGAEMYAKRALQADPGHGEAKALLAKAIETRRRLADALAKRAGPEAPADDATARRLAEAEKELADLKERAREQTVAELKERLKTLEAERRAGTGAEDSRDELLREFMEKLKADQERAAKSVAEGPDTANLTDASVLAAQYVAQADEYRKAGKFDQARSAVVKALRATPGDVEIILLLQQIEREAVRKDVEAGRPEVAADETIGPDAADAGTGEKLGPDVVPDATSDATADATPDATADTGDGGESIAIDVTPDEGPADSIQIVPDDDGETADQAVPDDAVVPVPEPPENVSRPPDESDDGPREIMRAIAASPVELESGAVSVPTEIEGPSTRRLISAEPVEIDRALPSPVKETGGAAGEGGTDASAPEDPAAGVAPAPDAPVPPGAGAASPVALRTPAERVPEVPTELPASVGGVLMALAELDVALEREDIRAFERLLSERAGGGAFSGGDVSRAEEIANVRDFFDIARGIRIDRTTRPRDVRADALRAEAKSSYRITYVVEGARMSRRYDATYRLARERGAWRIVEVTIQAEAP